MLQAGWAKSVTKIETAGWMTGGSVYALKPAKVPGADQATLGRPAMGACRRFFETLLYYKNWLNRSIWIVLLPIDELLYNISMWSFIPSL